MNPTDQARKEARKKELKKNKKQRQMVRAAVLKGKDPMQIIEEMEKIDQMEYNVLQPSPLNEKVLKDKRKKLRDTLDRVLKMYNKDDPEKWVELKRSQAEYERRRGQLVTFYESVKHAQQVSVDEIPLPAIQIPEHISSMFSSTSQIPLPTVETVLAPNPNHLAPVVKPPSILKRTTAYGMSLDKEPPGVPPGPPLELSSCSEDEDEVNINVAIPISNASEIRSKTLRFSDDVEPSKERMEVDVPSPVVVADTAENSSDVEEPSSVVTVKNKPTSLQQRMVALSGQNIDDFMKEMELVHKNKEQDSSMSDNPKNMEESASEEKEKEKPQEPMVPPGTDPQEVVLHKLPSNPIPPPNLIFRPPPPMPRNMMPLMAMRLPPGPPPGRPSLPPGPPPGLPPRMGLRLPPGPPPGMPPRMLRLPMMQQPSSGPVPSGINPNVLSAAPQLINRNEQGKQGATIMAKPQIRNLSADVTRFVPSALRVKREDKNKKNVTRQMLVNELKQQEMAKPIPGATKDDAYMQFMREMEGLL